MEQLQRVEAEQQKQQEEMKVAAQKAVQVSSVAKFTHMIGLHVNKQQCFLDGLAGWFIYRMGNNA